MSLKLVIGVVLLAAQAASAERSIVTEVTAIAPFDATELTAALRRSRAHRYFAARSTRVASTQRIDQTLQPWLKDKVALDLGAHKTWIARHTIEPDHEPGVVVRHDFLLLGSLTRGHAPRSAKLHRPCLPRVD